MYNTCKIKHEVWGHGGGMYQYSGGKLQIEKDVGHDEWEGAMLLHMYENPRPYLISHIG
jgi:hypothetical protein